MIAGVGLNSAGIGALEYLQRLGMAAAAVAHTSARIGDGAGTSLGAGRSVTVTQPPVPSAVR